jgi:hypothetical protein
MGAEAAHGLGLAGDAFARRRVQAFGLDQREGDIAVELGVMGEVDLLLAALAEEAPDLVAAGREGRWLGFIGRRRRWTYGGLGGGRPYGLAASVAKACFPSDLRVTVGATEGKGDPATLTEAR